MDTHSSPPTWLSNFIDIYSRLSVDNTHLIEEIYSADVVFIDPAHKLEGLKALRHYFSQLYSNVTYCHFVIDDFIVTEQQAAIYWTMTYHHKNLNRNQPIIVTGHSKLKGKEGKVVYHRDYLDLGAMLYEHVPVLGLLIRKLKHRLSQ